MTHASENERAIDSWVMATAVVSGVLVVPVLLLIGPALILVLPLVFPLVWASVMGISAIPALLLVPLVKRLNWTRGVADVGLSALVFGVAGFVWAMVVLPAAGLAAAGFGALLGAIGGSVYWASASQPCSPKATGAGA
ncbi:MAG: hypothetical protein QUV02_02935 [Maricaulis sp.]|jgi:hypothetical protein|uniref:hypothetical protein n=1 Tax=Maricaulis sp. TaxID=1486257 RepID=UPI001B1A2032|nr:hypothetical protein [Maricaulis sp.]MBO6730319.1 hypothetical protein [Maricaulis sp.]MBO6848530.1 hypothetical protein [Maricaulis sp.]MBO6878461.1 hypothetical protein [Maricaulis sp.]MDM7983376.1 hypothetical protein [Maricaulis sp.]